MKRFYIIYVLTLLFYLPLQGFSQDKKTPTAEQKKEIQDKLDKIKQLKKDGKGNGDPEVKKLCDEAIVLADKYYEIKKPEGVDGEPEYEPVDKGEGNTHADGKKGKVAIRPKAFDSPGLLASTKLHEFFHCLQLSDGRWPNPLPPGPAGETDDERDARNAKIAHINEIEAYEQELKDSTKNGLSRKEIDDIKDRIKDHYNSLDDANKKKVDGYKANGEPYKTAMIPSTGKSMYALVRSTELFVSGTVESEERMTVTIRGTQTVEGNVVTAELNGKKTEATTDSKGHTIIDMSAIAGGLVTGAVATFKVTDAKGNPISIPTTTSIVQPGTPMIFNKPEISRIPDNVPTGQVVTIPGKNLGAESRLVIGNQVQETLSASDKELTVFTDSKPGNQPAFVVTPNGVTQSQNVNIYTATFTLPKNNITPNEKVAAQLTYQSIPVGTKLIFTNQSASTVTMNIPGAENVGNKSIYTVTEQNGTIPVNITGIRAGTFTLAFDKEFKDNNFSPLILTNPNH